MVIRIFDRGAATIVEAPDDAIVHRGRVLGLPDMLEVRGGAARRPSC